METRSSHIRAEDGGAPGARWIDGVRWSSSMGTDFVASSFGVEGLTGELRSGVLPAGPEDAPAEGGSREDAPRTLGSRADEDFAVETGLAFDAPSIFVFERSGPEVERTELNGIDRLEILGFGGDDRLSIGPGVFGDREVPVLGGTVRLDGLDIIVFRGGAGDDTLGGGEADGPLVAYGGPGDDSLAGGSARTICGAGRARTF